MGGGKAAGDAPLKGALLPSTHPQRAATREPHFRGLHTLRSSRRERSTHTRPPAHLPPLAITAAQHETGCSKRGGKGGGDSFSHATAHVWAMKKSRHHECVNELTER
jgi:hypothetical protein